MNEDVRYSFTGHETFPFRYPWLAKGVRRVIDQPDLFSRDDAMVRLGVGKNMVRSIRHWAEVLGLVEKDPGDDGLVRPTRLGMLVFGPDGTDPFLECPGTLWLLQWLLVSRRERASTWHLLFTVSGLDRFTAPQALDWLEEVAKRSTVRATRESLKRDLEVFIRTYVPSRTSKRMATEESFDSPMTELGLIEEFEPGLYAFRRGPKPSLPSSVFFFAVLDYWRKAAGERQTLAFERLLFDAGSPGAAFKLSENALAEYLENMPPSLGLQYDETAGMRTLLGHPDTSHAGLLDLLSRYYAPLRGGGAS